MLPAEMRERRAITDALRASFLRDGYGEIETPAIEYDEVVRRGGVDGTSAYRVFDDHGAVLSLRTDMTVPIARVVASRYADAEPPLRFSYLAHAYRTVRPHRGQMREFLQAGVELVGAPAPDGTAEVLSVLCATLDAAGLRGYRIGLGDAALYPALLDAFGASPEARTTILRELGDRDFVGLEREVRALALGDADTDLLLRIAQRRGGAELLSAVDDHPPVVAAAAGTLRAVLDRDPAIAERIVVDLGVTGTCLLHGPRVRDLRAGRQRTAGGGALRRLVGRFGRDLPAVGFAVNVDRLQEALAREDSAR